jgi:hypothetical protein
VSGDPGPAVALFDALMASDFSFAAGGMLRDLAERIADSEHLDDQIQRKRFDETVKQVLLVCHNDDASLVAALLDEMRDGAA